MTQSSRTYIYTYKFIVHTTGYCCTARTKSAFNHSFILIYFGIRSVTDTFPQVPYIYVGIRQVAPQPKTNYGFILRFAFPGPVVHSVVSNGATKSAIQRIIIVVRYNRLFDFFDRD